jgi:hypothetical protein
VLREPLHSAGSLIYVWPYAPAKEMGQSFDPLFKSVPAACKTDSRLYAYLALVDAIRIDNQCEPDVALRFEKAHAIRPDDPNANANLALARTIQGRYGVAMQLAQSALAGTPRADHAIAYLLQAAARSEFNGDPNSLIPADLIGNPHADLGLAEFNSRRNIPV